VLISLHDREIFHKVPEKAVNMPVYEFEVNFSTDEKPDDSIVTAETVEEDDINIWE
jgi:hypothetical protein